MYRRLEGGGKTEIEFSFDGRTIAARPGDSVAAALLAAGVVSLRTTHRSGTGRGPFCLMGTCFDCLVDIDGETVQACNVSVSPGLLVKRSEPAGSHSDGKL